MFFLLRSSPDCTPPWLLKNSVKESDLDMSQVLWEESELLNKKDAKIGTELAEAPSNLTLCDVE